MRVLATALALLLVAGCSESGREAEAVKPSRPHAVLIVLDEIPTDTLLGPNGRIDAGRFPNLAALARDSTWFRNAHASYDSTTKAVPLILDGMAPRPGTSPDARDHPNSIFTALARRGYRVVAGEEASAVCPPRVCQGARRTKPNIIRNLLHGRAARFGSFLRSIRASRRPHLWMKHLLLPHGPWVYLPSGQRTRARAGELLRGMQTVPGFYDEYLTRHNEQRYLLQLGFVDRLIGRLVRRLKRQGIYDRTAIVVTGDHGFAWQVGVDTRRRIAPATIHEVGPVPLLVKRPAQRRPRVARAYARTLDVTPTLADVLNVRLGYRADGRSAFSRAVRRRRSVSAVTRDFDSVVSVPGRVWRARRAAVARRRLGQLGWGDWESLFTGIGPNRPLIGQELDQVRAASRTRATLLLRRSFRNVRRSRGVVPCQVAGRIHGSGPGRVRDLAVAVNGRVVAVGRSFHLLGDEIESYSVMVPEDSLREGRNQVEVLEVNRDGAMVLLAKA